MSREASGRKRTSLFLCAFVLPKTKTPVRNFSAHSLAHAYACMYNKEHPIGGLVPPGCAHAACLRPVLRSPYRPRCSHFPRCHPACARAAHAAIRPPPSSAPFTAHAVPPSSSAVLLRPLPSSSAGRCPLRCPARRPLLLSAGRQFLIPASSFLISTSKACCAA